MKNRDRLLKFIKFLKENPDVTDENITSRSIQEKITRNGLGLRNFYNVTAMAYLANFVNNFGGVDYFRSAPLEMIAGHRALALYVIHYLRESTDETVKCPFFKCSVVTAERLYRKIFLLKKSEVVSKEKILAMQHTLQSSNYCNDFFNLKSKPVDPAWNENNIMIRVQEFINQQVEFEKEKGNNIMKKETVDSDLEDEGNLDDEGVEKQEGNNAEMNHQPQKADSTPVKRARRQARSPTSVEKKEIEEIKGTVLYQQTKVIDRVQELSDKEKKDSPGKSSLLMRQSLLQDLHRNDVVNQDQKDDEDGLLHQQERKSEEGNRDVQRKSCRTRKAPTKLDL